MNNNLYSLAFSRAHDIILIADCDYQIIEANPAALETLGYPKEELLTLDISRIFSEHRDGLRFVKDICKINLVHKEYEFKKKDGTIFPVLINADKIDEETDTFMVVAKDITEYKKEKENHFTRKEMMLLGKMAQNIAHDLKNPLNNLFLGLHQFKSVLPEDNEEVSFYMNFLEKNSQRINELISSSLGLSAVFELRKEQFNLNELVNEAAKNAEGKIQLSNIILNVDLSDQPCYIELDKEKMLLALDNLILNAIESVPEEEGIIYIRTGQKNGKAALVISDNGQGMSATDMKNLYDPSKNGVGLGLVNTEQILNAHEVEMEIQSEIGKGSTFTLYF